MFYCSVILDYRTIVWHNFQLKAVNVQQVLKKKQRAKNMKTLFDCLQCKEDEFKSFANNLPETVASVANAAKEQTDAHKSIQSSASKANAATQTEKQLYGFF